MSDSTPLPYRALTSKTLVALAARVAAAEDDDAYRRFGGIDSVKYCQDEMFVCLVYDPKRVSTYTRWTGPELPEGDWLIRVAEGDTSKAFCEQVSSYLLDEKFVIFSPPELFGSGSEFRIRQKLIRKVS